MRTTSIIHSLRPCLALACLSAITGCGASAPEPDSGKGSTPTSAAAEPTPAQGSSDAAPAATEAEKDRLWYDVEEQRRVLAQPLPEFDPNDPVVARVLKGMSKPVIEPQVEDSEHVGVTSEALAWDASFFECMQQYAKGAYTDPGSRTNTCGTNIIAEMGTNQMQVQTQYDPASKTQDLVIAFRGTAGFADSWADLSSIYRVNSTNELDARVDASSPGLVGSGWKARWHEQLGANQSRLLHLLTQIADAAELDPDLPPTTHLHFVGHSLGAVVAELAAMDVEAWLFDRPQQNSLPPIDLTNKISVDVTAFNMPKLGDARLRDRYQALLMGNPVKFKIAQFTRSGDVVHNVPKAIPAFWHPVWNDVVGSKVMGEGSTQELRYCPQFNLAGVRLPLAAHTLADWAMQLPARPANGKCLFAEQ
jgi:hypothetical protein